MRDKKDSIFDSDILQKTAHLTHYEFGLFVRMAMIEDDFKTEKRYENISGIYLKSYMKIEEQWQEDFEPYTEDIKAMSDYSVIYTPAAKSRKGYELMKAQLENKNGGNKNENNTDNKNNNNISTNTKIIKLPINLKNKTKPIMISYTNDKKDNIPNQEDINDLYNITTEEQIVEMIVKGNLEKWEKYYEEILEEIKNKNESPFDYLKGDEE